MELKWVVDIWCRLFKHSVEELDLRGESSVDAEWIAYIGAFPEAVRLLATAAEERGPKGGWRRLLKRRKGRGKLLRRWTMAKMVVELKRINRGKKVTGFIGRGRGSGWLLSWVAGLGGGWGGAWVLGSWGLGWRVVVGWVWVESGCGMGLGVGA
ncbi:unnamed protein product [Prunus armeniaca]|uniref:Uncharacterized protein n=1 Tax=Prunus armeniaca TaxID=36596 RepID=A0A6J5TJR2_PRUAR|nr:unnamed protein product [Prunus armeniaca]